jgi:hypothetical protein
MRSPTRVQECDKERCFDFNFEQVLLVIIIFIIVSEK